MKRTAAICLTVAIFGVDATAVARTASMFSTPPASALGQMVGRVRAATPMRIVLALPLRDHAGADAFARAVSDPHNAFYGRYINPVEFGRRFGAKANDYGAVVAWAKTNGLSVGAATDARTTLSVSGPVSTIETLFATQLAAYRTPGGQTGFAPTVAPTLPAALSGHVVGVVGLASATESAPLLRVADIHSARLRNAAGTGVGGGYSPADIRAAYDIPIQLTPTVTETVAVFEQGGFYKSDVETFERHYHIAPVPLIVRNVNGYRGAVNDPNVELETVLDIDTLVGVNPAIKQVIDYEEGDDPFAVALLDSLAAMAQDNLAQTINISYGDNEANQGDPALAAENVVLLQMAAQGQSVFVSAGDDGAYGPFSRTLNVGDPGSQPYVTCVGGTSLFTGPKSSYYGETSWNFLGQGAGATGGGVSAYWTIPAYQLYADGTSVALTNGGSASMRNLPDVAAVGNPGTGASIFSGVNGGWLVIGGTSLSAPVWAGMSTIFDSAHRGAGLPPIGFYNPLAYYLAQNSYGLNDVTEGDNGDIGDYGIAGYNAGKGFDDVSGWGSIDHNLYIFNLLITQFGTGPLPGGVHGVTASTTSNSVTLTWKKAAQATGYLIQAVPKSSFFVHYNAVTTGSSVTVPGLMPNTSYSASVSSLNLNGANFGSTIIFATKSH